MSRARQLDIALRVHELVWGGRGRLRIRASGALPGGDPAAVRLRLRPRGGAQQPSRTAAVQVERQGAAAALTVECELRGMRAGRWDLFFDVPGGLGDPEIAAVRVPAPEGLVLPGPAACAPLSLRRAAPYRTTQGGLSIHVSERRVVRRVRRVRRLWKRRLAVPRPARRLAAGLDAAGRPGAGSAVLRSAGRLVRHSRTRAELLREAAERELARGREPRGLVRAYAAELAHADELYEAGQVREAAAGLDRAMGLAFHRVPQVDRLSAPLDRDPRRFTEPLRTSVVAREAAAPRGRGRPAAPPPRGRRLRLLIMAWRNANFLPIIRAHYERHPGVEARFLDIAENPAIGPLARSRQELMEFVLGRRSEQGRRAAAALRDALDWADTVFVEWCTAAAVLVTSVDPGDTKVIVRLHRYETYAHWPHLVDFSRIDDLVFVAEPVRELTVSALPRLRAKDAPELRVVSNALDLRKFARPKKPDARFTLGLVGIGQIAKDPRWALEVLRLLRTHDPRYRLIVMGEGVNAAASAASQEYHARLEPEFTELEESAAVRRLGRVDDVPAMLGEIGVILSSSVREGAPCSIAEGAASGAVPVVRDWPCYARQATGARTIYPAHWVVGSAKEAVDRILATTATERTWRAAGVAAAEHALARWDWSVVRRDYDRLLRLDDRPATEAGDR